MGNGKNGRWALGIGLWGGIQRLKSKARLDRREERGYLRSVERGEIEGQAVEDDSLLRLSTNYQLLATVYFLSFFLMFLGAFVIIGSGCWVGFEIGLSGSTPCEGCAAFVDSMRFWLLWLIWLFMADSED